MADIATLSERGQIVIPMNMRQKLHLEAGSKFVVYSMADSIVLKKLDIPSLDKWDEALKPLRAEASHKGLSEKGMDKMVLDVRRRK